MLLQATLNGPYSRRSHPALPVTVQELAYAARLCVAEGAGAIHLHPRDVAGWERLEAAVVDPVVAAVKDASGVPVGVSLGAWIEPDVDRRAELVRSWSEPDYALVDFGDPGADRVMEACLEAGVDVEAAVSTVPDVESLMRSGLGGLALRVLIDPAGDSPTDALAAAADIHAVLDRNGLRVPRMQFGAGHASWTLVTDAIRRGYDTRVGLEDTVYEPDGEATVGNATLIRTAARLVA